MSKAEAKCLIILSYKSSGSSACQNLLTGVASVRHVEQTRHHENETLYWTKAASILGMPQQKMLQSDVPIPMAQARADLIDLLQSNLGSYDPPNDDEELIFGGWKLLCNCFAPVFLEKSPHHLVQWSALELILSSLKRLPEIDFHFIGLIRNPLDTLYSIWKRWHIAPEQAQHEWLTAYRNLSRFEKLTNGKTTLIRYEDMVRDPNILKPVFDFVDATGADVNVQYLHRQAIAKWRNDAVFGFDMLPELAEVASQFGYTQEELTASRNPLWPAYRTLTRSYYQGRRLGRQAIRYCMQNLGKT
ncbi:MAG: sulfotransferase [Caldilineaceae bacterium]|nr:sulfotransferase [Caldilineaceae bacterium]